MNGQQLKQIYPQAIVQTKPCDRENIACITLSAGHYLWIDTTTLNQRELALLKLVTHTSDNPPKDKWSEFLTGQLATPPHVTAKKLQLLYFQVHFTDDRHQRHQWLEALAGLFDGVIHAAFTTANAGYLLVKEPVNLMVATDIVDLLGLVDSDFYTSTHLLLGSCQTDVTNLPKIYAFEQQLFSQTPEQTVTTVSDRLLPYLAATHQQALNGLTTELLAEPENQQLITALYQTQGNVRQAANRLYVHRNTLLYRIDKLERESGFNLKNMDDLVYCYLLTLAQELN